jgi:hypothetical protein
MWKMVNAVDFGGSDRYKFDYTAEIHFLPVPEDGRCHRHLQRNLFLRKGFV